MKDQDIWWIQNMIQLFGGSNSSCFGGYTNDGSVDVSMMMKVIALLSPFKYFK
jgi:hypothetical protein